METKLPQAFYDAVDQFEKDNPDVFQERLIKIIYDSAKHGTLKYQVLPCGHKFVEGKEPKRNCEQCWFTFFSVYGELTQTADEAFVTHGEAALVQLRGRKFTNNFKKYMSTLAHYQQIVKAQSEAIQNESSTSSTEVSSEDTAIRSPFANYYDDGYSQHEPSSSVDNQ
jgi:hypothetical protein